jgi:hypothetical protein
MHEALLVLAHAAVTSNLVARARPAAAKGEFPPAKDWFAIFVDYPVGYVSGLLKLERRQALDAIKSAESAGIKDAEAERRLVAPEAAINNGRPKRGKRGRLMVGERMEATLIKKPEALGWTVTEWVAELKCARAAVQKTDTWKRLHAAHVVAKVEAKNSKVPNKRRKMKAG